MLLSGRTSIVRSAWFFSAALLAHSALAQSWTQLSPSGTPPVARGNGTTGVYDSANNRMIVFGGRDDSGNNLNDVWVLVNANGVGASQWVNLIPNGAAGSPPARSGHSAVYDSANNRMIVFGGCSGNCAPVLNDVWVLTNANGLGGTPAWFQLASGTGPQARTNASAVYLQAANVLILFGGQDGTSNPCSTYNAVWELVNANGLGGSPYWYNPEVFGPPGLNGASAVFDRTTNVMTVFGGTGMVNGTCAATNAVWQLTLVQIAGAWENAVPEGAPGSPSPRSFQSAVYDAEGGRMLMFGGMDSSGNCLDDVWSLSNATGLVTPQWSMLTPAGGSPAARDGQAAIFDPATRRMTIFGGSDASGVLNDSWVLYAPGISELTCSALAGESTVRDVGVAELVGDLLVYCSGGAPTQQGEPIPEYYVTLTLNTNVTSRLLPEATGLSEALLLIDDPYPAMPVPSGGFAPGPSPPQIVCTPLGSPCNEIGTGGTPSPYQTQPNVFAGKQYGASTLYWELPIDPPGVNNTRKIRLVNVRANASQLGMSSAQHPAFVKGTLAIEGYNPPPLANPQLTVAASVPGIASLVSSASIPQCEPHNAALLGGAGTAAFDFSIQDTEGSINAFKFRNWGTVISGPVFPPLLVEQNEPTYPYGTETGFYSPSLFTTAPAIGLANFGTRILVLLGPISAGTHLFVPTTITTNGLGVDYLTGQIQLVQANEYGNSAPGYEPVASTAMIGATPVAEVSSSGALAYAVYEVVNSGSDSPDTPTIPVAVAFTNVPSAGAVQSVTTLAPLSSIGTTSLSAPIPRFVNLSSAQEAYAITSCAATAPLVH